MVDKLEKAIRKFKSFAQHNEDVQALIAFGSSSRKKQDEFSDLDLFMFTTSPSKYLDQDDSSWLEKLDPVLSRVVVREEFNNVRMNRIIMKDGLSLDIIVVNATEFRKGKYYFLLKEYHLNKILPDNIIEAIEAKLYKFHYFLKRGYTIIYDKVGIARIVDDIFKSNEGKTDDENIVTAEKFEQHCSQFWQMCHRMSLKLMKGDYYYAVVVLDNVIKRNLIRLIEWNIITERQEKNETVDVYYNGAKLYQWCTPGIIERLYDVFPHSGPDEMRLALLKTMSLYREEAAALARRKGYVLDTKQEQRVYALVSQPIVLPANAARARLSNATAQLCALAKDDQQVKALLSFGSVGAGKQDAFSNLDAYMITGKPQLFLRKEVWEKCLGNVLSFFVQQNRKGYLLMIILENGLRIDLVLMPYRMLKKTGRYLRMKKMRNYLLTGISRKRVQRRMELMAGDLERGYELLYDNAGVDAVIRSVIDHHNAGLVKDAPDSYAFYVNYGQFWQTNYHAMVKLIREDFYYAVVVLDNLVKKLLLEMIEWQYRELQPAADLFYNGANIREWCDEVLVKELQHIFPHSSIQDMRKAMLKEMDVYKRVSHALAKRYGYQLNEELENMVYAFVDGSSSADNMILNVSDKIRKI